MHYEKEIATRTEAFATLKENASIFRTRRGRSTETHSIKRRADALLFMLVTRTGLEPMLPP